MHLSCSILAASEKYSNIKPEVLTPLFSVVFHSTSGSTQKDIASRSIVTNGTTSDCQYFLKVYFLMFLKTVNPGLHLEAILPSHVSQMDDCYWYWYASKSSKDFSEIASEPGEPGLIQQSSALTLGLCQCIYTERSTLATPLAKLRCQKGLPFLIKLTPVSQT